MDNHASNIFQVYWKTFKMTKLFTLNSKLDVIKIGLICSFTEKWFFKIETKFISTEYVTYSIYLLNKHTQILIHHTLFIENTDMLKNEAQYAHF